MTSDLTSFQVRNVSSRDDVMRFELFTSRDGETFANAGKLILGVNEYFDFLALLARGGSRCTILRKDKSIQHMEGLVR